MNAPTVPMATPSLNLLREKFSELTRAEPHLGLNPRAPSLEGGVIHKLRQTILCKEESTLKVNIPYLYCSSS